jgi:hypothetical protein
LLTSCACLATSARVNVDLAAGMSVASPAAPAPMIAPATCMRVSVDAAPRNSGASFAEAVVDAKPAVKANTEAIVARVDFMMILSKKMVWNVRYLLTG